MKNAGLWSAVGALSLFLAGCADRESSNASAAGQSQATAATAGPAERAGSSRAPSLFAALPDRGELVRFDHSRVVHREGAYTWHPVDLSESHALNAIRTGSMELRSPSGRPISLAYERHIEHSDGNWTWIGRDSQGKDAVITFGSKAAFGSIPDGADEALRLVVAQGRPWLLATDRRAIAALDNNLTRPRNPDFLLPPTVEIVEPREVAASASAEASTAAGATVLDVVVGYTPAFASMLGGDSQARTRLNFLVEVTNAAYATSQINAQVRMVHAMAVDYADNTKNEDALRALTNSPTAALQPLRAARDQYGGDLVTLVRRFNHATQDGCGIAWMLGSGRNQISASEASYGYSIVSDSAGSLYPDGGYVCRDETFAHEIGHNLGSQHDKATATKEDGSVTQGVFAYSFGYKTDQNAGNFYTIMAYGDKGQYKSRVFSNPRISVCGPGADLRCGVADQADNARSISNTIGAVAAFRATVVPTTPGRAVRNDVNGDGKSDIVWRNFGLELQAHWFMNGPVRTDSRAHSVASIYRIVGTGDFDGDGRADLLWTNNTNDLLWIWRSRGDGGYDVQFVDGYPSTWAVEAVTDLNADGKSDILFRNPTAGLFDFWLMNGATRMANGPKSVAPIYRIVGSGDFDGDGRGDVLWTNEANDFLWIWRSRGDGQFDVQPVGGYPSGWAVKGVVDLNGDGKADIAWQNTVLEAMSYWWMNGPTVAGSGTHSVASIYRIVASGDYDGDGAGDLLWTNAANDLLWIWRSSRDGRFDVQFVDGYPPGWQVMGGG